MDIATAPASAGRDQNRFADQTPATGLDDLADVEHRPGHIKRAAGFTAHLARAQAYEHAIERTKLALIRDLVLGCPDLSDAGKVQATALILLAPSSRWAQGDLAAFISNDLLAKLLNRSEATLRRHHRELEAAGLVLRHMDEANHPAVGRRFDLRPLAARHAELSTRINAVFTAHARKRAARRFCRTAPDAAAESVAADGRSDPAGGAVDSAPPINTDTGPNSHDETVPAQQVDVAESSAETTSSSPPEVKASKPKVTRPSKRPTTTPRRGYWRPTDPTAPPRTLTSAVALLSATSPDFAVALARVAIDPADPSIGELLDAADRIRDFLAIPRTIWLNSHGRHTSLDRVAILVAAMAKPQAEFTRSRTAWACWMLSRQTGEIDIWATIHRLRTRQAKLN